MLPLRLIDSCTVTHYTSSVLTIELVAHSESSFWHWPSCVWWGLSWGSGVGGFGVWPLTCVPLKWLIDSEKKTGSWQSSSELLFPPFFFLCGDPSGHCDCLCTLWVLRCPSCPTNWGAGVEWRCWGGSEGPSRATCSLRGKKGDVSSTCVTRRVLLPPAATVLRRHAAALQPHPALLCTAD